MPLIRCDCGRIIQAETSEELVEAMVRHLADAHPDLPAPPSRADVLAMVQET